MTEFNLEVNKTYSKETGQSNSMLVTIMPARPNLMQLSTSR